MPKKVDESQVPNNLIEPPVPVDAHVPPAPATPPKDTPKGPDSVAQTPLDDDAETPWPEPELSKSAVDKRLRRVFQPLKDGTFKVSAEFVKQWGRPGPERNKLYVLFEKCNYAPDWMV